MNRHSLLGEDPLRSTGTEGRGYRLQVTVSLLDFNLRRTSTQLLLVCVCQCVYGHGECVLICPTQNFKEEKKCVCAASWYYINSLPEGNFVCNIATSLFSYPPLTYIKLMWVLFSVQIHTCVTFIPSNQICFKITACVVGIPAILADFCQCLSLNTSHVMFWGDESSALPKVNVLGWDGLDVGCVCVGGLSHPPTAR